MGTIKSKVSSAWEEIDTLKVPVNGAYQEADHANALVNGAWQEVWGSGIPFAFSASSHAAMYNTVHYTPNGSYADFYMHGVVPAQSGNQKTYVEIEGAVDIPRKTTFSVKYTIDVDSCSINKLTNMGIKLYGYSATGNEAFTRTVELPTSGTETFNVGNLTGDTRDVATIKIQIWVTSYNHTYNGSIKDLYINGQKCKFV